MDVSCQYYEHYILKHGGPCPGDLVKLALIEAKANALIYTGRCYFEN